MAPQKSTPAPGVQIVNLHSDATFAKRGRHQRDPFAREEGLRRLARVFAESPQRILQELVDVARELCAADSTGLSVEEVGNVDREFRWVATSGKYMPFQNATLPYEFAPCGICLDRGEPQLFSVGQAFFDMIGVPADLVTDGILIPWQVEDMRGTLWIVAHGETEAFDADDYVTVQALADFAAIAVRHQRQQAFLIRQATAASAARMANDLAHQINNPLQSITNMLFLAAQKDGEIKALATNLSDDVQRLSALVGKILTLPTEAVRRP
jgi:two-component sensor histidine kinase